MTMLGAVYAIRDVRDVERFSQAVLRRRLASWPGAHLTAHREEEALAYLTALAWELSTVFDDTLGIAWSTYLYRMQWRRLIDWYRDTYGDARYGSRPEEPMDPSSSAMSSTADSDDWVSDLVRRLDSDAMQRELAAPTS